MNFANKDGVAKKVLYEQTVGRRFCMNYYERRIVRERRRVMRRVVSSVKDFLPELAVGFMTMAMTLYGLPVIAAIVRGLWR